MKFWFSLLILLVATACGQGIDEAAAGTTTSTSSTTSTTVPPEAAPAPPTEPLAIWTEPDIIDEVRATVVAFTTALGIEVQIEAVPLEEMEGRITTTRGPDIFTGSHTWLSRLVPAGLVVPVAFEARAGSFEPVAIAALTYDGAIYGIPYAMTTVAFFRNTDLVPDDPGAFSQIKTLCEEMRGGGTTTTTSSGTTTTAPEPALGCVDLVPTDIRTTLPFLTSAGGYLYGTGEDGLPDRANAGIAGEGATAGANFLRGLIQDRAIRAVPDVATAAQQLAAGDAVFTMGGLDMAAALTTAGAPFAAAPLPFMSGNTPQPFVDVRGFMLAGRGSQQDTATLLLSDWLGSEQALSALQPATEAIPALTPQLELDPVTEAFLASARTGVPIPPEPRVETDLAALGQALAALFDPAQNTADVLAAAAAAMG